MIFPYCVSVYVNNGDTYRFCSFLMTGLLRVLSNIGKQYQTYFQIVSLEGIMRSPLVSPVNVVTEQAHDSEEKGRGLGTQFSVKVLGSGACCDLELQSCICEALASVVSVHIETRKMFTCLNT